MLNDNCSIISDDINISTMCIRDDNYYVVINEYDFIIEEIDNLRLKN